MYRNLLWGERNFKVHAMCMPRADLRDERVQDSSRDKAMGGAMGNSQAVGLSEQYSDETPNSGSGNLRLLAVELVLSTARLIGRNQ